LRLGPKIPHTFTLASRTPLTSLDVVCLFVLVLVMNILDDDKLRAYIEDAFFQADCMRAGEDLSNIMLPVKPDFNYGFQLFTKEMVEHQPVRCFNSVHGELVEVLCELSEHCTYLFVGAVQVGQDFDYNRMAVGVQVMFEVFTYEYHDGEKRNLCATHLPDYKTRSDIRYFEALPNKYL